MSIHARSLIPSFVNIRVSMRQLNGDSIREYLRIPILMREEAGKGRVVVFVGDADGAKVLKD